MVENNTANWKAAFRAAGRRCVLPALLLAAGMSLIFALGLAQRFGWVSSAASRDDDGQRPAAAASAGASYICPMMCTPPQAEPGRCPVCAMELVPATSAGGGGDPVSVRIDPVARRVANIQTAEVKLLAANRKIRAVGQLSYDEGRLRTLAAYVDGRLDRLYADYTGVVVNEGDRLALLYSTQLYTAQTELLAARRLAQRSESPTGSGPLGPARVYESARQNLIDLGLTPRQVEDVEKTGEPVTRIELIAPMHGTVIEKLAAEGDYVQTGQPIYRLADLTTVWLMLNLFPADAAAMHYGQRVEAEVQSLPGQTLVGRVAFVDPTVDPVTRTVGVRVVLRNERGRLKVGDYATATVEVPVVASSGSWTTIYDPDLAGKWISPRHPHVIEDQAGKCRRCGIDLVPAAEFGYTDEPIEDRKQLVVPRNAVLMAGDHSVVYVEAEPGRFELRQVELGPSLGDRIVLFDGVEAGEQVATNGNFLIDSQMQLAGKPSLIDPVRATASGGAAPERSAEIAEALARLSDEDRELAEAQRVCPVANMPLGSMGTPPKVMVDGTPVFICCEGCRQALLADPEKYLSEMRESKQP